MNSSGVLDANNNPSSYLVKQEEFIATANQTVFNLTKGYFTKGIGAVTVYINGVKQPNILFTETTDRSITLKVGLSVGDRLLVEYIQLANLVPYPVHGADHLTGGTDPIPLATTVKDGLMPTAMFAKLNELYTKAQIDSAISTAVNNLISGAPGALDTLKELATAMGNDPNFAATITNSLASKVDKVTGKGLSTEDFTTPLLTKLNGISAGANAYVHPSSHPASMITEDSNRRFTTDSEKASWNAKTKKYAVAVGNGSLTTITVTHNLASSDVAVTVRDATSGEVVYPDIQIADTNSLNLLFATAPTSGQYRVTVVG